MRKRDHLRAYLNHGALNLGVIVECLIHMVVPPQFDHTPTVVEELSRSNPLREFLNGTGLFDKNTP